MNKTDFIKRVEALRQGCAYQNYLEVRDAVFKMGEYGEKREGALASAYWREELAGLEYMLDASPLIIENLRHHCFHLTGLREYEYRDHHAARSASKLAKRLASLQQKDVRGLWVPESPMLGGFGFKIADSRCSSASGDSSPGLSFSGADARYNVDTLKFYEAMLVLDSAGMLDVFRDRQKRRTVLEIGAGWGGLAYSFKTLFPHATYVIVDLPGSILFGATYLKTLFPSAKVFVSDGEKMLSSPQEAEQYDFIFFPHFMWSDLGFLKADLVMNMASFQEMTTQQVEHYIGQCAARGYPYLFSNNRDRSPNNHELSRVSSVMRKYYAIVTDEASAKMQDRRGAIAATLQRMRGFISHKKSRDDVYAYRHLAGKLLR